MLKPRKLHVPFRWFRRSRSATCRAPAKSGFAASQHICKSQSADFAPREGRASRGVPSHNDQQEAKRSKRMCRVSEVNAAACAVGFAQLGNIRVSMLPWHGSSTKLHQIEAIEASPTCQCSQPKAVQLVMKLLRRERTSSSFRCHCSWPVRAKVQKPES